MRERGGGRGGEEGGEDDEGEEEEKEKEEGEKKKKLKSAPHAFLWCRFWSIRTVYKENNKGDFGA